MCKNAGCWQLGVASCPAWRVDTGWVERLKFDGYLIYWVGHTHLLAFEEVRAEAPAFKSFLDHSSRVDTGFNGNYGIGTGLATPRSRKYWQAHEPVYITADARRTILRNWILKKRNRKRNDSKTNAPRYKLQPQPLSLFHLSVNSSFPHQLLMASTLHHLPFINDKYSICTLIPNLTPKLLRRGGEFSDFG